METRTKEQGQFEALIEVLEQSLPVAVMQELTTIQLAMQERMRLKDEQIEGLANRLVLANLTLIDEGFDRV